MYQNKSFTGYMYSECIIPGYSYSKTKIEIPKNATIIKDNTGPQYRTDVITVKDIELYKYFEKCYGSDGFHDIQIEPNKTYMSRIYKTDYGTQNGGFKVYLDEPL